MSVGLAAAGGAAAGLHVPLPGWLPLAIGGIATLFASLLIDRGKGQGQNEDPESRARVRARMRRVWRILGFVLAGAGAAVAGLRLPLPAWLPLAIGGIATLFASVLVDRMERARDAEAEALRARREVLRPLRAADAPGPAEPDADSVSLLSLLVPERSPVAFRGRSRELKSLGRWRDQGPCPVLLVGGPAGIGKSRLALEFGLRSMREEWDAGWLTPGKGTAAIAAVAACEDRAVILVDEADGRADDVEPLLNALADHDRDPPIRVVLIARSAAELQAALVARLPDHGAAQVAGAQILQLLPEGSPNDKQRWVREAAERYAARLGRPNPRLPEVFPADWNVDSFVMLQIVALVAVLGTSATAGGESDGTEPEGGRALAGGESGGTEPEGGRALSMSPEAAIEALMAHERHRWRAVEPAWGFRASTSFGLMAAHQRIQARSIAVMALLGGAARGSEAEATLRRVPELRDESAMTLHDIGSAVTVLYPAGPNGAPRIQPDLIGEWFVVGQLADDPELADRLCAEVANEQAARALAFLARAADSLAALESPLRTAAAKRAQPALSVLAAGLFARFGRGDLHRTVMAAREAALSGRAGRGLLDAGVAEQVAEASGWTLSQLLELDREIPESVLARTRAAIATHIAGLEVVTADGPDLLHRASAALNLSQRLFAVRRYRAALVSAEQAVALYRDLAGSSADYQGTLARALDNLGCVRRELGDYRAAVDASREALRILQSLAGNDPSHAADVAHVLDSLSSHYSELGQPAEAAAASEEAVSRYRGLERDGGDELPGTAHALAELGTRLSSLGRHDDAERALREAVARFRRLVSDDPTKRQPLSAALQNLSNELESTGKHKEAYAAADEALGIRRELAGEDPVYLPDLGGALGALALRLAHQVRLTEACKAAQEGVGIFRRLAADDPAYQAHLARALTNLGEYLRQLDQREEAFAAVDEAVRLRRAIADSDPAAAPLLALSLTSLCTMLGTLGRYEDAMSAGEEAVDVLRGHAEADLASRGLLAKALFHVGVCLHFLGRPEEMLAKYRESVDLYADLAAQDPVDYQGEYAHVHGVLMRAAASWEVTGRSAGRIFPTGAQETEGSR